MSKTKFTGTATQPQRNRKICQFNNDQYCRLYSMNQGTRFSAIMIILLLNYLSKPTLQSMGNMMLEFKISFR